MIQGRVKSPGNLLPFTYVYLCSVYIIKFIKYQHLPFIQFYGMSIKTVRTFRFPSLSASLCWRRHPHGYAFWPRYFCNITKNTAVKKFDAIVICEKLMKPPPLGTWVLMTGDINWWRDRWFCEFLAVRHTCHGWVVTL